MDAWRVGATFYLVKIPVYYVVSTILYYFEITILPRIHHNILHWAAIHFSKIKYNKKYIFEL